MATKNTRYAVVADKMSTAERLASAPREGVIVYDTDLDLFAAYKGSDWQLFNDGNSIGTGWAQYKDDQYTSGSPLSVAEGNTVTIDNNGGSTIKSHLPTGITDFYDVATSKITPENSGDAYNIRIDFSAYTSSPSGLAQLKIDIGDGITPNVIVTRAFTFPKGTGSGNATKFSTTTTFYSLGTFLANGGAVQVESLTGNTTLYDVNFVITRTHKAT
jgi:hypothetical protein